MDDPNLGNPSKGGLIGWASNANNVLSTLGAGVAAVAAIMSTLNKCSVDRINQKLDVEGKQFDFDQKKAKAVNEFASLFLEKVLGDPEFKANVKHNQALLSIINLVAQASGGVKDSDATARAVMPLHLALMFNEPGALTAIDSDGTHLEDWVEMACADNSDQTRVTAIQALVGICQRALRDQRLDLLWRGIQSIDQLINFIPLDQVATRGLAVAARSQLASSIKRDKDDFDKAHLPKGLADAREAKDIRNRITELFANANDQLIAAQNNIGAKASELDKGNKGENKTQSEALKNAQVQLDTARAAAVQVTVQQIAGAPPAEGPALSEDKPADQALVKMIGDMASDNDKVRHQARSDAALFGQKAVKRLLSELRNRYGKNSAQDYRTRLGVAVALQLMRQPIELDEEDAYWVVNLVMAPDADTRNAAAEFMMNLGSRTSVVNCYDELERLFYAWCDLPEQGGNGVLSAATIVATWARVITPDNASRDPGKPFPTFALEAARAWKETLQASNANARWKLAIHTLDELIRRAESKTKRRA
jgi:hypothetical protein